MSAAERALQEGSLAIIPSRHRPPWFRKLHGPSPPGAQALSHHVLGALDAPVAKLLMRGHARRRDRLSLPRSGDDRRKVQVDRET